MNKPLLSVITVVFNNEMHIERTILSVLNQTYPNIEYLVIDGKSTDGTLQIIQKYQDRLAVFISEKDNGIYEAMNKGLARASGDYVIFMNSGDEFYEKDTVKTVFARAPDADIYYGETEMINQNLENLGQHRHKAPENFTWRDFKYGMSISHQAIFIRRKLAENYNLHYQLSSDIDWILSAAKKARKIVNVHRYVARYLVGGLSKKRHFESLKERFLIMRKHYGLLPTIFNHVVIAFNLGFYWLKHRRTND